ncbi:MAG: VPLPA-CTERM sorting domain-containing protein [Pseudorhodobacter sp.]
MILSRTLLCSAVIAAAAPAAAAVLTFDGLDGQRPGGSDYYEDGFRVFSEGGGDFGGDGSLHLDIAMGPYTSGYSIVRADGAVFSWRSLDITPLGGFHLYDDPDEDVEVSGYRADVEVGKVTGTSQSGAGTLWGTTSFDRIDRLDIKGYMTENVTAAFDDGMFEDVHFKVDNIEVEFQDPAALRPAVVPLPAGGALLVSGLFALTLLRRRKRGMTG